MRSSIGRNDPCPCGSGKKYKHCCLEKDEEIRHASPFTDGFKDEIREWLSSHPHTPMNEFKAFLNDKMTAANEQPIDDFAGLSATQMRALLSEEADAGEIVDFPCPPTGTAGSIIMALFFAISKEVFDGSVKPTVTGNLPRAVVRTVAESILDERGFAELTKYNKTLNEMDYFPLHITRIVAEASGLLTKSKSKFFLSYGFIRTMFEKNPAAVYCKLIQAYASSFNWGYLDRLPEVPIVQNSYLFTLYLLTRYGSVPRPAVFYEDAFMRAFPTAVNGISGNPYYSPEAIVRRAYCYRVLRNFLPDFGLVRFTQDEAGDYRRPYNEFLVEATPLLSEVVKFKIPMISEG